MHYKLFITRNEAYAGSLNWTRNGIMNNHDYTCRIIGRPNVRRFENLFDEAWNDARNQRITRDGTLMELFGHLPVVEEIISHLGDSRSEGSGEPPVMSMYTSGIPGAVLQSIR